MRTARRLVYSSVGCVFGLAGAAGWQAKQLEAEYKKNGPLPSARGPLGGVVSWSNLTRRASTDEPLDLRVPAKAAAAAAAASKVASAAKEKLAVAAKGVTLGRVPTTGAELEMCARVAGGTAHAAAGGSASGAMRRHVLFIGDSLVTGVGCSQESCNGPAMPRAVAEFLSRKLNVDVAWAAIGSTGSDVRKIQATLVPQLEAESARVASSGGRVDLVVVLCGLNDFKHASPWRTPGAFRHDLSTLIGAIHERVGNHATIVLPALPVHRAPVFDNIWPLSPLINTMAAAWDCQKESLAASITRVCYVRNAEADEGWAEAAYWAKDGIHPSDEGYRVWGEYIGDTLLNHLRREWALPAHNTGGSTSGKVGEGDGCAGETTMACSGRGDGTSNDCTSVAVSMARIGTRQI